MYLILFDIDGTLVLTGRAGMRAMNRACLDIVRGDALKGIAFAGRTDWSILDDIVRKHGPAAAHAVMLQARAWLERAIEGTELDSHPDFAAWDEALKAKGLNPGTSADLTVATVLLCGLLRSGPWQSPVPPGPPGHCGSAKP